MSHHSQLEYNTKTGEPFLRLPSPSQNIVLTPPRLSDAPSLPLILDDPAVHPWLDGPPYPYPPDAAIPWLESIKGPADESLAQIKAFTKSGEPVLVEHCPVRYIREVQEDGSDVFIGDVDIGRATRMSLACINPGQCMNPASEEVSALELQNKLRKLGDPEIIWHIGDFLAPSHHGKGIMSKAVATMMQWAISNMGIRRMVVTAFKGNTGSVRVFEKNGFVLRETLDDCYTSRGVVRGLHVLNWKLSDESSD